MENRFKVIISNRNLYKEVELAPEASETRIGTGIDCDVRLRKDLFFTAFSLHFVKIDSCWSVDCSNDIYLSVGDARMLMTKELTNGDTFDICYRQGGSTVFTVSFLIDFDDGSNRYGRQIDLGGVSTVVIGGSSSCNIVIRSPYIRKDQVTLSRSFDSYTVTSSGITYGVYINGIKVQTGGMLKDGDFLSVSDFFFYYKNNTLYTQNRPQMQVNGLRFRDRLLPDTYPLFTRNTRIQTVLNEEEIEVLDPPTIPQKPKQNLLTRLLPSLGMLLMALVMLAMGSVTMIIMAGISGGIAVITAVISYRDANQEFEKNTQERIRKYNAYIAEKQKQILSCRAQEKQTLEEIYISQSEEKQLMDTFSPDLFDRSNTDEDFLCVNLGTGSIVSKRRIKYKKQERLEVEDSLQLIPEQMSRDYRYVEGAPVVCDLKEMNAVGITGSISFRDHIFKNMVFDLISRQYFTDIRLVMVAEERNAGKVSDYRFLPHVNDPVSGIRMVVTDDDSKNIVFEYLYKELNRRSGLKNSKAAVQQIVIFLYDDAGFANHPLSKFVQEANDLGVTFVFFGETKAQIPPGCGAVIAENGKGARLIPTENKAETISFSYPVFSDRDMKRAVSLLAPVYSEEISLEGSLTKNYSMFEMLHIIAVDDLDLNERWSKSRVFRSMAAPVGISKSGIISLDLHDKAHGPHGLVAGTTGSGKSEVLQTYILSMATLFHPYEVGFVIIDFKGGGMVNQFRDLPHLRGAITNIDGKQINRSLKSIKAELQTRQRLFAEADVNHIDKYIRKYQAKEVTVPLPHLILIVDEFAELKADQPEFMKELISAARIGRSLGVHLILATQKPSGQVNEQIWSNSRFKICLKVQDQADSNEVLKSPLAAEIQEPGRAYLQVGNNEIFELFQSAYSGAPEHAEDSSEKEFVISRLNVCGKRTPVYVQKRNQTDAVSSTQLDAIVRYVADYCTAREIRKLPDICLPPLPEYIACPLNDGTSEGRISVGIYDDPDHQYQGDVYLDFDTENTFVAGASQTGKTNLLQLIIRRIASVRKADEANFYIMDFGSMILKNFEDLHHVGGVVLSSEEEKLKNLFKLLLHEVEVRKEKMVSAGVSSFSAYREAGYTDLPQIYVMIDNFSVFRELYIEKYEADFLYVAREGISCGISVIVTSGTTSGFGTRYMANFGSRIAFTCNNSNEYFNIFDKCRIMPENLPGRMLVSLNKEMFEAQSFLGFEGEREVDRAMAVRRFVAQQNERNAGCFAVRIPEVPASFGGEYIYRYFNADPAGQIAVALNYATVEPLAFDIMETPLLAIYGKQAANAAGFSQVFLHDLQIHADTRPAEVFIIDGITKALTAYADVPVVKKYTADYTVLGTIFEELEAELADRYEAVLDDGMEILSEKPLEVVWINSMDAVTYITGTKDVLKRFNEILSRYKKMKVMLVFAGLSDEPVVYASGEVLKKLKENRNALIFTNAGEHKVFDLPLAFVRQNKKPLELTQGYYLKENETVKFRFASEVRA